MLKKIVLHMLLLHLPLYVSVHAQPQENKQAKKIILALKTPTQFFASFTYCIHNTKPKNKDRYQSSGEIWVQGSKFKLLLKDREIICDGKTVWHYVPENQEVHINDLDNNIDSDDWLSSPLQIFTIHQKGFVPIRHHVKHQDKKTYDVVELIALEEARTFYKIWLTIGRDNQQIKSIKAVDHEETNYEFYIQKMEEKLKIPADLFAFDSTQYSSELEMIDLR